LTGGVKLCGFLLFLEFFVFFPESLDSTRGVDKFLFTGKKRMTFGADFNTDIRFGRTDLYLIAACTSYARFMVLRMNSVFHVICTPYLNDPPPAERMTNDELCNFDDFVKVVLPIEH
jgi:hypothetical protein